MKARRSKIVEEKSVFKKRLEKLDKLTLDLFNFLKDKAIETCEVADWGFTNKPDFRLAREYVFLEMVPLIRNKCVRIFLRIDNNSLKLKSNKIRIDDVNNPSRPGIRWIYFHVFEENEINDALKLINQAYRF